MISDPDARYKFRCCHRNCSWRSQSSLKFVEHLVRDHQWTLRLPPQDMIENWRDEDE